MKKKSIIALTIASSLSIANTVKAEELNLTEHLKNTAADNFEVIEGNDGNSSVGVKIKRISHVTLTSVHSLASEISESQALNDFEVIFEGEAEDATAGIKIKRIGHLQLDVS